MQEKNVMRAEGGMSLVELIVVVVIGLIMLGLLTRFFASQNRTYESQVSSAQLRGSLRAAVDLLQREVRNAGYNPTGAAFYGVPFDSSKLILNGDFNGDGDIADADEQIEYYLDRDRRELLRGRRSGAGVSALPDVVIDGVDTFRFELRDGNGNPVTSPAGNASVRQVKIRLKAGTTTRTGAVASQDGRQLNDMDILITPRNLSLPKVGP